MALLAATTQLAAGADRFVSTAVELQQALNAAVGGDTITLQAGTTFSGYFQLAAQPAGSGWITIRSSALAKLPGEGIRVSPGDAPNMPKLVAPSTGGSVLQAGAGAHHYRVVGIELTVAPGIYTLALVSLGYGTETSVGQLPHDLEFDRVYLHGDSAAGGKRGIALNCGAATIKNSWISNFKSTSQDAQAIAGWNGPGPYQVLNNYLEGSGENIILGGTAPTIAGNVPSDVVIAGNRIAKPLEWQGQAWSVKNLLELKNARRVTIDGNILENNWVSAQNGFAILFTPRSDQGEWPVVEDIAVTNNIIRHTPGVFNIDGYDDVSSLGEAARIRIENNLLSDISGTAFQILNGVANLSITHNTVLQQGFLIALDGARKDTGLVFTNNIAPCGKGIFGSGYAVGNSALGFYAPGSAITANVLAGCAPAIYPQGNFFPASLSDVGFVDLAGGNYALGPASPYLRSGTDGKGLGADVSKLPGGTQTPGNGSFTAIRVNAGGSAYTDRLGQVWSPDSGFSAGSAYSVTAPISGTSEPTLYQCQRYAGTLQYQFPVPSGKYNVKLKFAEIYFGSPGQRVFHIVLNGTTVQQDFDPIVAAGAPFTAVDRTFSISASGQVLIQLVSVKDNPILNAIEITPAGSPVTVAVSPSKAVLSASQTQLFTAAVTGTSNPAVNWSISPAVGTLSNSGLYTAPATIGTTQTVTVSAVSAVDGVSSGSARVTLQPSGPDLAIRINAGGPAYSDSVGQAWSADTGYTGGATYSVSAPIAGTSDVSLYRSQRYGAMQYRFSVPAGSYNLKLKFAELYFRSPGKRVFNIVINGTMVLQNFDALAAAGGAFTVVDRRFSVISNGQITIQLNAVIDYPILNAIEISPASPLSLRFDAGGAAYTDFVGQAWIADTCYMGGGAT